MAALNLLCSKPLRRWRFLHIFPIYSLFSIGYLSVCLPIFVYVSSLSIVCIVICQRVVGSYWAPTIGSDPSCGQKIIRHAANTLLRGDYKSGLSEVVIAGIEFGVALVLVIVIDIYSHNKDLQLIFHILLMSTSSASVGWQMVNHLSPNLGLSNHILVNYRIPRI